MNPGRWVVLAVIAAAPAAAQETPIKGARITLAPKATAVERITLENRRDAMLVAFQVGLFRQGATEPSSTYSADFTFDGAPASARGPIAARERRSIDVEVSAETGATSAVVLLAQFADGHCEGRLPPPDSGLKLRMPCPKPTGTATSVAVTSERTQGTKQVALVENLSDVAIEAFRFEVVRQGVAGTTSVTNDYCVAPRDTPSPHGRIQPREAREVPIGSSGAPGADPELRLTFVLFDDLTFEGSAKDRQELFAMRERTAESYTFASAALRQAAALPVPDAVAFLQRKRNERSRELRAQGRDADVPFLGDAIDQARREPETFAMFLKALLDFAEQQRQQLLRHQAGSR